MVVRPDISGAFARGGHELIQVCRKIGGSPCRPVLEHKSEPTGSADTWNRRRRKGECIAFADFSQFAAQMLFDRIVLLFRLFALAPFVKGNKEKSAVSGLDNAQKIESNNGSEILDARGLFQNLFDFTADFGRPLERSGFRQLESNIDIPLIFFRQENWWAAWSRSTPRRPPKIAKIISADSAPADCKAAEADVIIVCPLEGAIEPTKEAGLRFARL